VTVLLLVGGWRRKKKGDVHGKKIVGQEGEGEGEGEEEEEKSLTRKRCKRGSL
jgi:hypothetical protein